MSFTIQQGLFSRDFVDYYAVLGLPIMVDPKLIRKRYLKIANSLHPDKLTNSAEADRQLAGQILSKLVNPAYQHLMKDQDRTEYQLVLSQIGRRLADGGEVLKPQGDLGKKLLACPGANLESLYAQSVQQLAEEQYQDLSLAAGLIGQLSELNQVFLQRKQGQGVRQSPVSPPPPTTASPPSPPPTSQRSASSPPPVGKTTAPESPAAPYLRRAESYFQSKNYSKAILELRDALKLEPNNASAHAMMGYIYLTQQQTSMAKVHITKALHVNPKEPLALKVKEAMDKQAGKTKTSSPSKGDEGPKSSFFGGLFGGKKK